jgi:hypothetical protein
MSEPVDPRRRVVRFLDERDLLMAAHARLADRRLCLAVNPASAFREESPANVVAFGGSGILWALPLDFGRLELVSTTRPAALVFDAFWTLVERALGGPAEGPGPATVWFSPTGVGDQPERGALGDAASGPWLEYRGARPWIELGTIAGQHLLVPSNRPNDSTGTEPDRAYRVRVLAAALQPAHDARALQQRDSMIELSHFAILDPAVEGWTREGHLQGAALAVLRRQFLRWAAG